MKLRAVFSPFSSRLPADGRARSASGAWSASPSASRSDFPVTLLTNGQAAALPVPADQRWFWTDRWQEREREVDAHVAAGGVTVHKDGTALLDHLDQLDDREMKFETTPAFDADYRRLKPEHRAMLSWVLKTSSSGMPACRMSASCDGPLLGRAARVR